MKIMNIRDESGRIVWSSVFRSYTEIFQFAKREGIKKFEII